MGIAPAISDCLGLLGVVWYYVLLRVAGELSGPAWLIYLLRFVVIVLGLVS